VSRALLAGGVVAAFLAGCSGGEEERDGRPVLPPTTERGGTSSGETSTRPDEPSPPPLRPERPGAGRSLGLEVVASGFDSPVHAAVAPGEPGRLYVVEQAGRVRVLAGSRIDDEPFLDLTAEVTSEGNEQGLLSIAFHPRFQANSRFYVNFTDRRGDTRVDEFRVRAGRPTRVRRLLHVGQPYANHNGGQLAFGPDGLLYVGMGDGGSGGDPGDRAQDLSSPLGKLLRLDVDDRGAGWEPIAYGLRNPWRFSFDRLTGDLWIGDVGQNEVEEIDVLPARRVGELTNFGWDVYEGTRVHEDKEPTPGGRLVGPVSEYGHDLGCSVTGGFVYRGRDVHGRAGGRFFYGDYCSGRIWSLARWQGETTGRGHSFRVPELTSFAEDADGELLLLSRDGTIYRLARRG
jgi:glucose/arabinose dehydrogenase